MSKARRQLIVFLGVLFAVAAWTARMSGDPPAPAQTEGLPRDPANWGSDHVGQPVPDYMTGGECLFCHRKVGENWHQNRHHRTIRDTEGSEAEIARLKKTPGLETLATQIVAIMGDRKSRRFLKATDRHGQFDLLSTVMRPASTRSGSPRIVNDPHPHWDERKFGAQCAGCHASGVESDRQAFSTPSLDCYTCHGEVDPEHANDPKMAYLGKARHDPPRVVTSICASCHLRTGTSKRTGLPYPDNFVAGDNLFRDFKVDFSAAALSTMDPGNRHVYENVRDVALLGKEGVTCLSCHDIHGRSSKRHRDVRENESCATCHEPTKPMNQPIRYESHSARCEY